MRILEIAGALCVAGTVAAGAIAPASAAPVTAPSAAAWLADAEPAQFVGWHPGAGWHGGWRRGSYAWRGADDDACSGDHPPWTGAYAGYPSFWCSPGFGAHYRHWPQH